MLPKTAVPQLVIRITVAIRMVTQLGQNSKEGLSRDPAVKWRLWKGFAARVEEPWLCSVQKP